jgi:hypothetical protein
MRTRLRKAIGKEFMHRNAQFSGNGKRNARAGFSAQNVFDAASGQLKLTFERRDGAVTLTNFGFNVFGVKSVDHV